MDIQTVKDKKLKLTMLSAADSVKGQGVGSAYTELMRLLDRLGQDDFDISVNKGAKKCDVVHAHTIGLGSYLRLRGTRSPSVVSVHFTPDMISKSVRMPKPFMSIFLKYILRFYRSADYVHVVNPDLRKALTEEYGFSAEKIHYIPNFVAKSQFFPMTDDERAEVRKKYGIKDNDFLCFASGQTRAGKGVHDFVAVAKEMPDVKFIWAGGFSFGPAADGYNETKEMLKNLPDNVQFIGIVPRDDINGLLNAADLFFFPSYQELFPMSILEAASTNTPLLLRNLPEYQNILAGYFYSAETNEEFIEGIKKIRDDKQLYDELVKKSAEVSAQYSEERTYELWKEFYSACAGREA